MYIIHLIQESGVIQKVQVNPMETPYRVIVTNSTINHRVVVTNLTPQGPAGKSAYQYAVDGGYTGTEEQFISDLADVSTKESLSNKKTDIEANKDSNIFYATIKAIYDWCVGKFEPLKGSDDNYVTDAEKVKLSNLSGINTGDQDLSGLQLKLVSGENLKTINNQSLLGSENITITASSTTDNVTITGEGTEAIPFQISEEYQRRINAGI